MRNWMRSPATVVACVLAAGVASGVAWAAIPDGTGTIHACYGTSERALRVVDAGSCNTGEAAVAWNQNGVQGPQGAQGAQGSQGNPGAAGLPGLTFADSVSEEVAEDPVIGGFFKELSCPSGEKALVGSWEWEFTIGSNPPQGDVESFPIGDDSWGFAVGADKTYKGVTMFVFLDCVDAR